MKQTILTILFILLPLTVFGQLKVGTMNPDAVLDALPETEQVETQIQQYIQERQAEFQDRYQVWIEDLTEFSELAEAGEISGEEQARREEQLQERQEELSNMESRIQQQIQQRQNELFSPLLNRVDAAMSEVAEELELEFVINQTASSGDPIVYYSSQRGVDITERVIQKLTQN
ncbi:OmpH family outer membrane protein [Rhodohalobacter sp.]|uniref:OmpH family outer membrane protein n=1 Tax=Rhodohalobacter sp. TaxID=1974210 RepID=UPI002ACE6DB5|nr:OmpH family outer membrane protein [Rhodohalobacter sp.]MDZ7756675.1 OmpH family outer membrane protein [Rhodohalobacter sp.]